MSTTVCQLTAVSHLTAGCTKKPGITAAEVAGNTLSFPRTLTDSCTVRKSAADSGPAIITSTFIECHAASVLCKKDKP